MAPICELGIPLNQFSDQPKQKQIDLCNAVLDVTLTGLKIPDKKDREFRIDGSGLENNEKTIKVSYTCGADEYGVGEIFEPSDADVAMVVNGVFDKSKDFGIDKVVVQGWRDSLFIAINSETKSKDNISIPDSLKDDIPSGFVSLFLSPKIVGDSNLESKKEKRLEYSGEFRNLGREICSVLGIYSICVVYLLQEAETDLGVEVKLNTILRKKKLSKEEMGFLGEKIIQKVLESGLMNRNGERSGNLWIKQGLPSLNITAK
ncbi:MAG: hypothetical protein KIH89_003600 [Candidatus Shapirobacteria bacterium]|nr:hypothetical protein [Candidatus Shapirobacteria bacterium]